MTTLVIGSGLVGSQIARILVERGEKPVLMDRAAQPQAIAQIVDPARVTLVASDVYCGSRARVTSSPVPKLPSGPAATNSYTLGDRASSGSTASLNVTVMAETGPPTEPASVG